MHVRHLNYPADAPRILSFMPELYERNFPGFVADAEFLARRRAQLREATRDPGQVVLVAEDQGGVCGFIWLIVEEDYQGRRRGEVSALHVAAQARRGGIGRLLMQEGEAILRQYGCESVHLMVTTSNTLALHLYDRLGYEPTRYQMEKRLSR